MFNDFLTGFQEILSKSLKRTVGANPLVLNPDGTLTEEESSALFGVATSNLTKVTATAITELTASTLVNLPDMDKVKARLGSDFNALMQNTIERHRLIESNKFLDKIFNDTVKTSTMESVVRTQGKINQRLSEVEGNIKTLSTQLANKFPELNISTHATVSEVLDKLVSHDYTTNVFRLS